MKRAAPIAVSISLASPHHPALAAAASETDTNGPTDRELLSAEVHGWPRDPRALYAEPGRSSWVVQDGKVDSAGCCCC